jgi:hypothetical protein
MTQRHHLALALALALAPFAARAQHPPPTAPMDAAARKAVIDGLATQLKAHYVFPDVAQKVSASLAAKEASGGYNAANDTVAFAELLSADLRTFGRDGHFRVGYAPNFKPAPPQGTPPDAKEAEEIRQEITSRGFGIESVRRLTGNVGYLEVRGFGPTDIVAPALTAAMQLLSGTDALILDLRRNGGGEPASVAHLLSHFFPAGDERHLNDLYFRESDTTRQYWTNPSVATRYTRPVYVLTSARTFSGGEECAYDLQTQKRATLVGEATGGGANPGDGYAIGGGFAAFIPNGRSINPVTKTNWEHTGVTPDIAVPAADAQKVAHAAILTDFAAKAAAPEERDMFKDTIARAERDEIDLPKFAPRKR